MLNFMIFPLHDESSHLLTYNDLQEMSDYISNVLYNPQAAARIKNIILDTCGHLKEQPFLGLSVQEKTGYETDLRFLVCELFTV